MPPKRPELPALAPPRRARRLAVLLTGVSVVLVVTGALWFVRAVRRVQPNPAVLYRDPTLLDRLLKRANDAERAGDRATAIATYRFVASVGEGEGAGAGSEWSRYGAAARAGLRRLGVGDTLPGPRR